MFGFNLSARLKRILVITLVAILIFIFVYFMNKLESNAPAPIKPQVTPTTILDPNLSQVNLNSLATKMDLVLGKFNLLTTENQQLKQQLLSLEKQLLELKGQQFAFTENLNQNLFSLSLAKQNNQPVNADPLKEFVEPPASQFNSVQGTQHNSTPYSQQNLQQADLNKILTNQHNFNISSSGSNYSGQGWTQQEIALPTAPELNNVPVQELKIYSYSANLASLDNNTALRIPAASILVGSLVTGVDAPTHEGAKKDPYPLLVRLDDLSFLPNAYRTNLSGCFVLLSSYGDLSSERAYMRAESISCVNKDNLILQGKLQAFVSGKDGKNGIAGRVVSRQGSVIGKSLAASFLQSVSTLLGSENKKLSLDTSKGNKDSAAILQNMGLASSSDAINKVSQFYLDIANNMFPFIEINAGSKINLILSSELELKFSKEQKLINVLAY